MALGIQVSIGVVFLLTRDQLGYVFSRDPEVAAQVSQVVYIAALFQLSDGIQACIAGIMRGMGRQHLVALLNFLGFWGIGIPLGAALAFSVGVGLPGLWWGLAAGLTTTAGLGVIVTLRTNWEEQAEAALRRVALGASGGPGGGEPKGEQPSASLCSQEAPRSDGALEPGKPPMRNPSSCSLELTASNPSSNTSVDSASVSSRTSDPESLATTGSPPHSQPHRARGLVP